MKDEKIFGYMNELMKQIPSFLAKPEVLKKHLQFMRYFPDYEWFNIASILYSKPDATNVKSVDAWDTVFERDVYVKKGEKGMPVMIPIYHKEEPLDWKFVKVFDIEQMSVGKKPLFVSPFKSVIDKYGLAKLKKYFGENWIQKFIDYVLDNNKTYKHLNIARDFIQCCCLFSIVDLLDPEFEIVEHLDFVLPKEAETHELEIYKCIKESIDSFPDVYEMIIEKESLREQTKKEVQEAIEIQKMSIHQRMDNAKFIVQKRLQEQMDGGGEIVIEDEEHTVNGFDEGIPSEPPKEEQIFLGVD